MPPHYYSYSYLIHKKSFIRVLVVETISLLYMDSLRLQEMLRYLTWLS
jgi:hypothetical protein